MKNPILVITVAAGMLIGSSYALSQDNMNPRPYIGGNYGLYKSDDGDYDEDRNLWELYGGVAFNDYIALEVAYTDLGELSNQYAKADIDGWSPAVVGQLPLTESFSIYGKVGRIYWEADVDALGLSDTLDGDEFFYTLGAGFTIADPLSLTLEYSQYEVDLEGPAYLGDADEGKVDTVKAGLRYAF